MTKTVTVTFLIANLTVTVSAMFLLQVTSEDPSLICLQASGVTVTVTVTVSLVMLQFLIGA